MERQELCVHRSSNNTNGDAKIIRDRKRGRRGRENSKRTLKKGRKGYYTGDIGFELGFETGVLLPERVRRMFLVRRKYIKTPDKTEFWH